MSRLREPSTWAGFAGLLLVAKVFFPAYASIIDGLAAAASSAAIGLREPGGNNAN